MCLQTDFYNTMIFNRGLIKRGAFVEDRVGALMLHELRGQGRGAHARWGTWLHDDGVPEPMVCHLDGRGMLLPAEKEARRRAGQAGQCSAQEGSRADSDASEGRGDHCWHGLFD